MLLITAEETATLLDMSEVIAALEPLYGDAASSAAGSGPRVDLSTPGGPPDSVYTLKGMMGLAPRYSLAAVRLSSDTLRWQQIDGQWKRKKVPAAGPGCWVGLVLVFDTRTGTPLALFADGYVQRARTAAANGVAARYLARRDAQVMGLIGTGWQAGAQVLAMLAVRDIQRVQVWSPDPGRCRRFAAEMADATGVRIVPADDSLAAAQGADVVCTAVSANGVLTADMVSCGQFLTNVRATEFNSDVYKVADHVVVNLPEGERWSMDFGRATAPALAPVTGKAETEPPAWQGAPLLQDVVSGRIPGRASADQITVFINNFGSGLQFAAVAKVLLENAEARGVGRELPDDWFLQAVPT